MKKKVAKKDVKAGKEKIFDKKYWNDPMCGPIRP